MKKLLSHEQMPNLLIRLFLLYIVACIILFFFLIGYVPSDLPGHWRICKYTLEGYNPYLLIGKESLIPSIGQIPRGFSTVPWSCVFGNLFYGGFMPLSWATTYIFVLHFGALFFLIYILYHKFYPLLSGKALAVLILLPCTHFSFTYSLSYSNSGGIICCILIIALLISHEHPLTAGVLLGLSMMKPQIAAISGLVFLLNKQWKVLTLASIIVMSGWISTAIITSTPLLELLLQTFNSGTAEITQYLGLLNNLKYFNVNSKLILLLNMAIGAVYVIILYFYIKKQSSDAFQSPFIYVPACIASTFWIYKNGTDYSILTFASIFFCMLCVKKELPMKDRLGSIVSVGYLQMSRIIVYLAVFFFKDNLFIRDMFKTADGIIIAIIGIYLCKLYVKNSQYTITSISYTRCE